MYQNSSLNAYKHSKDVLKPQNFKTNEFFSFPFQNNVSEATDPTDRAIIITKSIHVRVK